MPERRLIFLGGDEGDGSLLHEGVALTEGAVLPLVHRRSPWREPKGEAKGVKRVILGSHSRRADVRLEGPGIHAEHVRFYFPPAGPPEARPLLPGSLHVNGRPAEALEWIPLSGGEELRIGTWRFRYEEG